MNATRKPWALVTGASAGIGAEFCRQLAGLGYSLTLVARREQRMQELAGELSRQYAVDCRVLAADLSAPDVIDELMTRLRDESMEIEFLVNNAGYGVPGKYEQPDWEVHRASLDVMLNSVCELTWQLLPDMQRRGRGFIVNVASLAGLVPGSPRHTLYGATKAFLIKFSQSLALENHDSGVAVSALCPGFTYSEFHDVLGLREQVNEMPRWMWMDAPEVVTYGIDSVMRKKIRVVAVPGRANRFIAMLSSKLPQRLTLALAARESHRWREQD